jgi:hypothetical protein
MPNDETPEDLEEVLRKEIEANCAAMITKAHAETMTQLALLQAAMMERFDRMGDTLGALRDGVRAAILQQPPLSPVLALDIARKYERLADTLRGAGQIPGADQADRDARRWRDYGEKREPPEA